MANRLFGNYQREAAALLLLLLCVAVIAAIAHYDQVPGGKVFSDQSRAPSVEEIIDACDRQWGKETVGALDCRIEHLSAHIDQDEEARRRAVAKELRH